MPFVISETIEHAIPIIAGSPVNNKWSSGQYNLLISFLNLKTNGPGENIICENSGSKNLNSPYSLRTHNIYFRSTWLLCLVILELRILFFFFLSLTLQYRMFYIDLSILERRKIMNYKFKTKPYAHQLKALELSWDKPYFAYFMEMGTGKSKVLIDNIAMLYDAGKINGVLIIAPKGVYKNWYDSEKFLHTIPDHVEHDRLFCGKQ